jgi:Family of unknown function (DUF6481)
MAFKQPTFQERAALAAKAKQAALDKLKAKPPVDDAVIEQRRQARLAREAAAAAARAEKIAARELEKVRKLEEAAAKAAAAPKPPVPLTPEEQKAIRDAKYAARKNRLGKR